MVRISLEAGKGAVSQDRFRAMKTAPPKSAFKPASWKTLHKIQAIASRPHVPKSETPATQRIAASFRHFVAFFCAKK